jgi:hypothetical protein
MVPVQVHHHLRNRSTRIVLEYNPVLGMLDIALALCRIFHSAVGIWVPLIMATIA